MVASRLIILGISLFWVGVSWAGPEMDAVMVEGVRTIDRRVASWLKAEKKKVPEISDDAVFLRRAFLVTVGRIPTAEEARAFLDDTDPEKRRGLISHLVHAPGYSWSMTNWAFDLLRVTDRKPGFNGSFEPYRAWVARAMVENRPWDQFTREVIAAKGNPWSLEGAPVGYYLRDRGMPLDNLANTTRIFLGSRMECAQCHDDPFGTTERRDFYELAAFTHGLHEADRSPMRPLWDELEEGDRRDSWEYRVARELWDRIYGMSVVGGGEGRIRLPEDYQYRDGDPGEWIGGRTPFGKTVRMSERSQANDGRAQLAEWVTERTGEQFASVIANRMWARVMGRPLYDPVDEYQDAEDTRFPELVRDLSRLMVALDYDLQRFQWVLLNTRAFEFAPNPEVGRFGNGEDLMGRPLARLAAEQIWDSLVTLAKGDPDQVEVPTSDGRFRVNGRLVGGGTLSYENVYAEVMELGSEAAFRKYFADLVKATQSEGSGGGEESSMVAMGPRGGSGGRGGLVRACFLPSPAPRDHLLYVFGQSDREIVEGGSREPNVGQVLTLMNGFVQKQLVENGDAQVFTCLEGVEDARERVRRIYLAVLGRPPTDEELSWMMDEVRISGSEAWRNIVAVLVMSSEFVFIQ
ncbi:hypothetical protein HNR46_003827 [Haloferula luteola]|uniref:DUF1549 domain-containing protein n=1 Tax=Haloferula luteola TaxID=595692 RepID=A0A840V923_9BACT|nr:DUF1549 domain-containing protein [Haloferula luteola]MBB5353566.1 hypothetical protein [Haloferula luteola]